MVGRPSGRLEHLQAIANSGPQTPAYPSGVYVDTDRTRLICWLLHLRPSYLKSQKHTTHANLRKRRTTHVGSSHDILSLDKRCIVHRNSMADSANPYYKQLKTYLKYKNGEGRRKSPFPRRPLPLSVVDAVVPLLRVGFGVRWCVVVGAGAGAARQVAVKRSPSPELCTAYCMVYFWLAYGAGLLGRTSIVVADVFSFSVVSLSGF